MPWGLCFMFQCQKLNYMAVIELESNNAPLKIQICPTIVGSIENKNTQMKTDWIINFVFFCWIFNFSWPIYKKFALNK